MGGNPGLRPLGFGEILDVALKIVGRHFRQLGGCVLVAIVPIQILGVLLVLSVAPEQYNLSADTAPTIDPDDRATVFGALFAVRLLEILTYVIAAAACFKAVADGYLGRRPAIGRSLAFGLPRVPRLFGLYLVVSICTIIGLILLIAPGVWLITVWSLALPALLFERLGVFASLGRSVELVKGRSWMVLGLLVVSFLLLLVVGILLGVIAGAFSVAVADDSEIAGAIATFGAGVVSNLITMPLFAAVLTVLYFDQRVRKEGFDLQLLAEGIGEGGGLPAPPPEAPLEPAPAQSGWQPPGPPPPGPRGGL